MRVCVSLKELPIVTKEMRRCLYSHLLCAFSYYLLGKISEDVGRLEVRADMLQVNIFG
mgnify:CR=1 FL=1